MEKTEFLKQQYLTLREEIKETKARIFYIAAIGLFVLPGGQYLAKAMEADLVLLALPLLVVCVGLLYLAENRALMRCGRYIRQHIESAVQGVTAWEEWLESRDASDPRTVDKLVAYALYLLMLVYYALSTAAAYRALAKMIANQNRLPEALLAVSSAIGVAFLALLVWNVRSTTTTVQDPPREERGRGKSGS